MRCKVPGKLEKENEKENIKANVITHIWKSNRTRIHFGPGVRRRIAVRSETWLCRWLEKKRHKGFMTFHDCLKTLEDLKVLFALKLNIVEQSSRLAGAMALSVSSARVKLAWCLFRWVHERFLSTDFFGGVYDPVLAPRVMFSVIRSILHSGQPSKIQS